MTIDISGLDATELEALIMRAAQRRTQLTPAVPIELPRYTYGKRDPRWVINAHDTEVRLHIRDSGIGWLTFLLPKTEALNMGKVLISCAEATMSC